MKVKSDKRIALVGFGFWGRNLARNLHRLHALCVICDSNADRLDEARKTYANLETSEFFEDILTRNDIDGVVLATPSVSHKRLAIRALSAGKDVFVEKPLALSVSDGLEIVQCAKDFKRVLLVGHVLEYHPAILKLKSIIANGRLGRVRYFYSHRLNFGRVRRKENVLWSFAPHDIAILLRLLDRMPEKVTCLGGRLLNSNLADTTMTNLQFKSGLQAHIFVNWLHPFKVHRMVVIGDKQTAVFDDTQPWKKKLSLFKTNVGWDSGQIPYARQATGHPLLLDEKEPLLAECEHFLECMQKRKTPHTDGQSAIRVLQVLETAQHSMGQGGAVMKTSLFQNSALKKIETADPSEVFIHPSAIVSPDAIVGKNTKIWHFTHVMGGATIGRNCILGQNTFVGKGVVLGDQVKVQNNVSLYEGVVLKKSVFCGPSVVFTNIVNPRSEIERKNEFKKTLIQQGATLGANATIVCGVNIGRYAFIAAGAVVTRDVPDYALVMGIPARLSGWMCRCGQKLKLLNKQSTCDACGRDYKYLGTSSLLKEVTLLKKRTKRKVLAVSSGDI